VSPTARLLLLAALLSGVARAHVTPPVVLVPEREAVARLLSAPRLTARDVRLSDGERAEVRSRSGWRPPRGSHRLYVGRDGDGRVEGGVLLVTDHSTHGPVRVAVGLDREGRVTGATVVELAEETYPWVRPLVDADFAREYVGQDARGAFAPSERLERAAKGSMPRHYARVLANLLRRAAVLYEVGMRSGDEAG
jgi:hypothetical protein